MFSGASEVMRMSAAPDRDVMSLGVNVGESSEDASPWRPPRDLNRSPSAVVYNPRRPRISYMLMGVAYRERTDSGTLGRLAQRAF